MQSMMKVLRNLVWITQLGLSVVTPLVLFVLLAVWLHDRFGWGTWVIWVGVALGIMGAVGALRNALHTLSRIDSNESGTDTSSSFNNHD